MAIASEAMRFKLLDKETNLPTLDFKKLTDNAAYNTTQSSISTVADGLKQATTLLKTSSNSLTDLNRLILNANNSLMATLKSTLNSVISFLESIKLPPIISSIFASLKALDLPGVKGFLGTLMKVGRAWLCGNLDSLKLFSSGFTLNLNVLAGVLCRLLVNWVNRFCKGPGKLEFKLKTNLKKIQDMFPPGKITVTTESVVKEFVNYYSDYLHAKEAVNAPIPPALPHADFIAAVKAGNINTAITNLRSAEITSAIKKEYLASIDTAIATATKGSKEMNLLLQARGTLSKLPLISVARRDANTRYSDMADQVSNFVRSSTSLDSSKISTFGLNPVEQGLVDKVKTMQTTAKANADLMSRDNRVGNAAKFDLGTVLPTLTDTEKNYVMTNGGTDAAHKSLGIHPTSMLFV